MTLFVQAAIRDDVLAPEQGPRDNPTVLPETLTNIQDRLFLDDDSGCVVCLWKVRLAAPGHPSPQGCPPADHGASSGSNQSQRWPGRMSQHERLIGKNCISASIGKVGKSSQPLSV